MDHRRPKKIRGRALAAALLLLAGCGGPALHPLDARHPASAEAPEGALDEPAALRSAEPEPGPQPPPPAHHDHGGEARDAH